MLELPSEGRASPDHVGRVGHCGVWFVPQARREPLGFGQRVRTNPRVRRVPLAAGGGQPAQQGGAAPAKRLMRALTGRRARPQEAAGGRGNLEILGRENRQESPTDRTEGLRETEAS